MINATEEVRVGDIGTILEVTLTEDGAAVNISTATTIEIKLKPPEAATKTKTATFSTDGSDGKIRYITISGDIDEEGQWRIQGHVILPTGEWHSAIGKFVVEGNL